PLEYPTKINLSSAVLPELKVEADPTFRRKEGRDLVGKLNSITVPLSRRRLGGVVVFAIGLVARDVSS
ncbi:MAG: hypothetical protein WAM44_19485, partial [Chthoniobacterales bacterium]